MKPCSHLSREQKGPANAYRTDGVQLVGVEQHPGFQSIRSAVSPEPVGCDAVKNIASLCFGQVESCDKGCGQIGTLPGMAKCSFGLVLKMAADVMQVCRRQQHRHVRLFRRTDPAAEANHPQGMFPVVAAPCLLKLLPGKCLDKPNDGRVVRGYI